MMFRDINQSSTMARSAYPDGNGELTDFNLFATKYDAGKPSIATDGLPSELSYQVRTAIRRAVEQAPGFEASGLVIREEEDLAAAVGAARETARKGDVVVLSPACAAFDRFKNFMERGQAFKRLVQGL